MTNGVLHFTCFKVRFILLIFIFSLLNGAHATGIQAVTDEEKEFVRFLQEVINADQREKLSQLVFFPIVVVVANKKQTLGDSKAFLRHYDAVINNSVKSAVLMQDTNALFKNWQGVMIGRGELWFADRYLKDGKKTGLYIVAINNGSFDHKSVKGK